MKKAVFVVLFLVLILAMALPVFADPVYTVGICHRVPTGDYVLLDLPVQFAPLHEVHHPEDVRALYVSGQYVCP